MRYRSPPRDVTEIVDAQPLPFVIPCPRGRHLAIGHRSGLPTIEDLSEPMLRLAGRRVRLKTNGRYEPPPIVSIELVDVESGSRRPVRGLAGGLGFPSWSPDGERFAVVRTTDEGVELWLVGADSAEASRMLGPELNGARGEPCTWLPTGEGLVCHVVDPDRGPPPAESYVPLGPAVQESTADPAPARTFQDLLEDEHDDALYEFCITSQPILLDLNTGDRTPLGMPGTFESLTPSPGGDHFLAVRTVGPYSRSVPDSRFAKQVEVWDSEGGLVRTIAHLPVDEGGPERLGFRREGYRSFAWRPTAPATVDFVESLDGGDPNRDVEHRDRILTLEAPFEGPPREFARTEHRMGSGTFGLGPEILWCESGDAALVSEFDWPTRRARTWLAVPVEDAPATLDLLWDRSTDMRYDDPGRPLTVETDGARPMIRQWDDRIYLTGEGGSPGGDRPFLDAYDLSTRETRRVFQSAPEYYEFASALVTEDPSKVLVARETASEPTSYIVVDTRDDSRRTVASFPHPQPQLLGVRKERISYEREDGIPLSGDLHLPAGYEKGMRLPMVLWGYPREYADAAAAGESRGSCNRFAFASGASHLLFLTQGYAVFDGSWMPIVGGSQANDTYIDQLAANAEAAVSTLVDMGVADRDRIGVAGHSYGAFMAANLLAHTDLFAAGIARSGAFNRSLTPFGFQSERRAFWDAPDVYHQMSPFMHADKIEAPLLLIHGMIDGNPGTFPLQSQRLFQALKGLGRPARLVMLPNESHGYRARESVLHTVWEMFDWMNKHLGAGAARSDS